MKFLRSDDELVSILLWRKPGIIFIISPSFMCFMMREEKSVSIHFGLFGLYLTSDKIKKD